MEGNPNIRLAFEAYAQFSSKLMACINYDGLQDLLGQHLKYLFNYESVRVSYLYKGEVICHQVSKNSGEYLVKGGKEVLNSLEKKLEADGIPRVEEVENSMVRGWRFGSKEQGVLLFSVSTLSDQALLLNQSILNLLAESLLAKFLQFNLYEALDSNNEKLNHALYMVQHQNDEIRALARLQRIELAEKTSDIRAKNEELQQIVKLNAHEVREPLSRIMGLINLLKQTKPSESIAELPLIEEASKELDLALRQVIVRAETKLKSQIS